MEKEAEDTMPKKVSDDKKKNYTKVIAKVDSFSRVRKNVIFERAILTEDVKNKTSP